MTGPASAGGILHVDLSAIVANWRLLCARHPSGPVAGVVKGDGYGLGAVPIARALYAAGCRHFFVALLDEALAIRDIVPDAMLGVLGGLLPGTEAAYIAHRIVPVLGSLAEIDAWTAAGPGLPAMLHIDTGMARLGLDAGELATLQQNHARMAEIDLRYILTHLVSSESKHDMMNRRQREYFGAACAALPSAPRSFANSSGIFLGEEFGSDLARPGAALYGINPTPGLPNPMHPVLRLMVRVLAVRDILTGATVGYNATWTAQRPSRIATAGIGYADGWHRALSGRCNAFFDGAPVPLVGRVSMDLTTFDITGRSDIAPGAWLELLGPHQSPDTIAEAAGTNGYEILTSLALRLPRVYEGA
ncbi:MAG: alanine racemase [Rhodospirillales bacterium]